MHPVEHARLCISNDIIPRVRRDGASRVFLATDCAARLCGEPPRYGPRDNCHPQPELACFLSGTTRHWLGDEMMAFGSGDFLLIPPGLPHYPDVRALRVVSGLCDRPRPTSLWITGYPQGATMLMMQIAGDMYEVCRSVFLADALVTSLIRRLLGELPARSPADEVMVQACLLALLAAALRCPVVPELSPAAPEEPAPEPGGQASVVAAAREFIHARYSEEISLARLAENLFVSQSHLSRQFKRETGSTIVQYLTQVRINAARELLQTDLPIYAVAGLVGFADPLYFSQVFRRTTGVPPTEYRASLLSGHQS